MKKILMLNLTNLGKVEGGTIHQLALLRYFRSAGHTVTLVAPRHTGTDVQVDEFRDHICLSTSVARWGWPLSLDGLLQIPAIFAARLRGANVIYARANLFTVVQVVVGRMLSMRVVVEHNSWVADERLMRKGNSFVAALDQLSQVWSARLAHHSRCVTPGIAKLLVMHGVPAAKTTVIGNGTDVKAWGPMRGHEHAGATVTLGFIGILSKWQGLETALKALRILRSKGNYTLHVAGDGPERAKLEALAQKLGIVDRVSFFGHVDYCQAPAHVAEFDICLAPFTRERNERIGLAPIKIRDYAAAGKPVVAAAIPGITDLSDHGWLWTHTPDDAGALAGAIEALVNRGSDFLHESGVIARRYAEEHFDWDRIAAQVEKLL